MWVKLSNNMVASCTFITVKHGKTLTVCILTVEGSTYNSGWCVKGSISSEFEVDYYEKLEEVIK